MVQFIKKLLTLVLIILLVSIVPSYVIDPYNVFHWDNVRENGVDPNKNYIKTRYLLSNPDKYDAILFGSSRVGAIHVEKIANFKVYNMTYSYGVPAEHLQNIKTFLAGNIRFKRIYIGVDGILLTETEEKHRNSFTCSYEYLRDNPEMFYKLYCNPFTVMKSIPALLRHRRIYSTFDQIYNHGWWLDYDYKKKYDWNNVKDIVRDKKAEDSFVVKNNIEKSLNNMKEIVELCNKNGIELVVFTNPMIKSRHIEALNNGYVQFLRALTKIVPYYNFSGLNDITINNENYVDPSHYSAYIGDMMINVIENGNRYEKLYQQGFGWYVNEDNFNDLVPLLETK